MGGYDRPAKCGQHESILKFYIDDSNSLPDSALSLGLSPCSVRLLKNAFLILIVWIVICIRVAKKEKYGYKSCGGNKVLTYRYVFKETREMA